jgi:hypothetical protein
VQVTAFCQNSAPRSASEYTHEDWRRGSESNEVFTDHQPQHPDLQEHFNAGFTGVQAPFTTTRRTPALSRHAPTFYSAIEEIVEGFLVELTGCSQWYKNNIGTRLILRMFHYGTERMRQ